MSTTLDALQAAGGVAIEYVVAIEGYGVLLTSYTPAAALTAWSGTDWTEAVGGLEVDGRVSQTLDPWRPFGEPGQLMIRVAPCPGQDAGTDRFAEDWAKRTSGTSSELTTNIDCNDTSIVVKRADDFSASGTVYVENEAIGYSSRDTGTDTFTVSTRGKWSPFTTESGARFSHPHRKTDSAIADGVTLPPDVTSAPRGLIGRWVAVYIHRRVGTTLDTKAEAHLYWAGTIREAEETESGVMQLTCEDARASLANTVLLRDQYRARVKEGFYVPAGVKFYARTIRHGTTYEEETAGVLTVVSSGASGAYQVDAGVYRAGTFGTFLSRWLAESFVDGNALFAVTYNGIWPTAEGLRPRLSFSDFVAHTGADAGIRQVIVECSSPAIMDALGWTTGTINVAINAAEGEIFGPKSPTRVTLFQRAAGLYASRVDVDNIRGVWFVQGTLLPPEFRGDGVEGVLKVGDALLRAELDTSGTDGDVFIVRATPLTTVLSPIPALTEDDAGEMEVAQVFVAAGTFRDNFGAILSSTGTSSFNNSYDVLGEAVGCAIPHSLIDSIIDTDLVDLENPSAPSRVYVDKPTKLADKFAADLIIRKCFVVWKNGQLRLVTWATPTSAFASTSLTESNKAAPVGTVDRQRSRAFESDAWMRNVVKVRYGLRPDGKFMHEVNLEDAASVRRYGAKPVTIDLASVTESYATFADDLVASFCDWMPILSRPVMRIRRTMNRTIFETATPGSHATITDEHVRDWSTGLRGITGLPAFVTGSWYDYGGAGVGEDGPPRSRGPAGEVEVMVFPTSIGTYVPCAEVDEGQTNAGYDAGTFTLTCHAHRHSESSETADAAWFFTDDAIRIVEVDPSDPASPTTWTRAVASQTGNTITLATGLSSPAWDNTKRYRIIYAGYADCESDQTVRTFQADDADGLIADSRAPYEYGSYGRSQSSNSTSSAATTLPSRYAQLAYGDGVPLDVGYEYDIANLANNLASYKQSVQTPHALDSARTHASGTWQLVEAGYFYFGAGTMPTESFTTKLYLAPRLSVSSGTGSVRVTLTATPPTGASRSDVTIADNAVSVTFTTTSATAEIATTSSIDLRHLNLLHGLGMILVEVNANTSYYGMPVCYVGPLEAA